MTVPTLVIHGDDDQIAPMAEIAAFTSLLASKVRTKIYRGAPHGLPRTHGRRLTADLLEFLRS